MSRTVPHDRFEALIDAATRVFLAQGYRRTQMADVAAALGVAKGTLYLYVETKEALFDAVLRCADAPRPIALPSELPVPTPAPGATLAEIEKRIAEESSLPLLAAALERPRRNAGTGEIEAVLGEAYDLLMRHRTVIELLDRCAHDHPELAAVWYGNGRSPLLAALARFLTVRVRLAPGRDADIAARIILETLAFWAVHRHWDPSPQAVEPARAREAVVSFLRDALVAPSLKPTKEKP